MHWANTKKAEFIFYRINYNGLEEAYFKTTLENARVVQIEPLMFDIKHPQNEQYTHHEYVDLIYEKSHGTTLMETSFTLIHGKNAFKEKVCPGNMM